MHVHNYLLCTRRKIYIHYFFKTLFLFFLVFSLDLEREYLLYNYIFMNIYVLAWLGYVSTATKLLTMDTSLSLAAMHCDSNATPDHVKRHQQQVDIKLMASEYLTQLSLA